MRAVSAAAGILVLGILVATPVFAADPSPAPTPHAATCAERYPGEGPAQVDLRLGCIANELVGHYTRGGGDPAPISSYLGQLVALVGGFVLLFLAARFVLGRASKRMAPASPGAYWLCPSCRSVNDPTRAACYACAQPWTPDAAIVPTAEHPEMVQRFGGDRKSGSS